ncbi:MAG TPA: tetratricopeptide repeat protein [Smithella sp.]|nr:tetratricopeptide repeat protein [Smithella sp.]HOG91144.1 tetratricopeptide repeat protein [Smithella sp.]
MMNKNTVNSSKQNLIIYIVLIAMTSAVYWPVHQYGFIIEDDVYVMKNSQIQSGITLDVIRWSFSTVHAELWHPLTWLSLIFDYQLHGLNAGGYHVTNLILHILGSLLLFSLFNRMTADALKSAFVAAFFALHPLNVESVAWISERKDVLSGFFWMLTMYLYVCYTEKPTIRRYLIVIFSFVLALMSKPMVVTLPVIMILLDYWPLKRFESHKANFILWQLREKAPFFVLSIMVSIITLHAHEYNSSQTDISLVSRLTGSSFAFVTYLGKIFWPHDLAFCHPSSITITLWPIWCYAILIIFISVAVIVLIKRMPYLFVGWLWYAITILPVIGLVHSRYVPFMFDHFTYLPSIGIFMVLVWGVPLLFRRRDFHHKVLFPASIAILLILSVLTVKQRSYWENSMTLFHHTLQITKKNALAYHHLGYLYDGLGRYQEAIDHYSEAIRIKPYHAVFYNNRGVAFAKIGQHQSAVKDFDQAIRMKPDFAEAYINRGKAYLMQDNKELGCRDAQKACKLGNCTLISTAKKNKYCF